LAFKLFWGFSGHLSALSIWISPSGGTGWRQQHAHKIGLSPIMPALALAGRNYRGCGEKLH